MLVLQLIQDLVSTDQGIPAFFFVERNVSAKRKSACVACWTEVISYGNMETETGITTSPVRQPSTDLFQLVVLIPFLNLKKKTLAFITLFLDCTICQPLSLSTHFQIYRTKFQLFWFTTIFFIKGFLHYYHMLLLLLCYHYRHISLI